MTREQARALVIAALIWGAFLRLYQLDALPPLAWVDELWHALMARELVRSGDFHVFYPTFWGGMLPGFVDLAAAVHATGIDALLATRLVSALGGVAAIPLAYLAISELARRSAWSDERRRQVAALTAAVVSSLLYLTIASRIGYAPSLTPALTLLYVWQTQRAMRTGGRAGWVVAGLTLGAAQYVGLHSRFTVLVALAFASLEFTRSTSVRRQVVSGHAATAGVAFLVCVPLIAFYMEEPHWLVARAANVTRGAGEGPLAYLVSNAARVLASLVLTGDPDARHNIPYRPMLDALQSIGFLSGMVWSVRHMRHDFFARAILVWLPIALLPSVVTDAAPHFERIVDAGIPIAVMVGIGWVELVSWAVQRFDTIWSMRRIPDGVVIVAPAAASAVITAAALFAVYPHVPELPGAMTAQPVELARELISRSAAESVFVERLPEAEDVYAFEYLMANTAVRRIDFRRCLPLADARDMRTTFLVFPAADPAAVLNLRRHYPSSTVQEIRPPAATLMPEALLFEIAPGERPDEVGAAPDARFEEGLTLAGLDPVPGVPAGGLLSLTTWWTLRAPTNLEGLSAFAHLVAHSPGASPVAFSEATLCQGLYSPESWRAGELVPAAITMRVPRDTPPGEYVLAVGWQERPALRRLELLHAATALAGDRAGIAIVAVLPPAAETAAPAEDALR